MASIRRLIRKNTDRARHWLPYVQDRTRELIMLVPSLFCLGEDMTGIFAHPTCTLEQYSLLKKHLDGKFDVAVARLPDYILIESLIMVPRPSIVSTDFLNLLLIIIPTDGAPIEKIEQKCSEIELFFRARGIGMATHILHGKLPPLTLYEVMRLGIVLAGRHPIFRRNDETEMSFFAGEIADIISDTQTIYSSEWNPFQHILECETETTIRKHTYHPHMNLHSMNPFIAPYMPMLIRYEEELNADMLLTLRLCISALFFHFGPTRETLAEMMRAWRLSATQIPDVSNLSLDEAMRLRNIFVPLDEHELPVFSWPPNPFWQLKNATLVWDGPGWRLGESESFLHKHAWVVLAWAAISGLIGSSTLLKTPDGLLLKTNAVETLASLKDAISKGADIITSSDPRQESIRINRGRFFFSDSPYAILERGRKISLVLFKEIKKKALLDDSGL